MEEQVELADVQGIVIKGYVYFQCATFLMLHINDVAKAKAWIADLAENDITNAEESTKFIDYCTNIAFTNHGMKKLGMPRETMNSFSREFEEGMVTPHRTRMLGDNGQSAPENWAWGNPEKGKPIHVLLMLYAKTPTVFDEHLARHKAKISAAGLDIVRELETTSTGESMKEHFGFRDGIGSPVLKNAGKDESLEDPANLINPGEFLFGYKNEYDKYTFSPTVATDDDKDNLLAADKNFEGRKDLGRNGSMLVFRTMEQHVREFWEFLDKAVKEQEVENTSKTPEELGAKMVGRWMNGTPLALCPHAPSDDPQVQMTDKFGYAKDDFDGFKCPIGSHIRRTNPRDQLVRNSATPEKDIEASVKFMKRFRILRRGRLYGDPLAKSMDPQDVLKAPPEPELAPDGMRRGLHFLSIHSNIGRQFELMQQTWVNNPKFAGLYNDTDPLIGHPEILDEIDTTTFTEQAQPLRKRISGLPRFVTIKGGAYFFVPGIQGLRFLGR